MAEGVERVTGRPAMSVGKSVSLHADELGGRRSSSCATPNNTPQPARFQTPLQRGFPAFDSVPIKFQRRAVAF
jgi:hypothetical protein